MLCNEQSRGQYHCHIISLADKILLQLVARLTELLCSSATSRRCAGLAVVPNQPIPSKQATISPCRHRTAWPGHGQPAAASWLDIGWSASPAALVLYLLLHLKSLGGLLCDLLCPAVHTAKDASLHYVNIMLYTEALLIQALDTAQTLLHCLHCL